MNPRINVNTYLLGKNGTYLTKIVPHEYRWCSVPCSIHLNCSTILSHAVEWQWDCDVLEKTFFTNQTLWSVLRNSILVQKLFFWEKKAITTFFSKMLKFLVFYNYIQNEWGKNEIKKIKAKKSVFTCTSFSCRLRIPHTFFFRSSIVTMCMAKLLVIIFI